MRVVAKHDCLGEDKAFEEWGASMKCKRGGRAVEVTKMMPSSAQSTNTFCEDEAGTHFFVPASLLRVGGLQLAKKAVQQRSSRSRAPVRGNSTDYYEMSTEDRQVVGLRCRADDLPPTSYEVEQQQQHQRAQRVAPPCTSQPQRMHELSKSVLDVNALLQKTAERSKAEYINGRVDQVSGMTVEAALMEMVCNTRGDSVKYTRSDIRYDVQRGLLELQSASE